MAYVIVLVVLAIAVLVISAPLRGRVRRDRMQSGPSSARAAELEAARDAKYREIRDAELDLRTGKLSREDYEALDARLRAEAIEIMHALDRTVPPLPSPR